VQRGSENDKKQPEGVERWMTSANLIGVTAIRTRTLSKALSKNGDERSVDRPALRESFYKAGVILKTSMLPATIAGELFHLLETS
jgi:carbamoylphosphate synthase small subunit